MLYRYPPSGKARTVCTLIDDDGRTCPPGETVEIIGTDQPPGAPIWLYVIAYKGGAFAAFPEELAPRVRPRPHKRRCASVEPLALSR